MLEEGDEIIVRVEVPGIHENDLRVTFEDGLLTQIAINVNQKQLEA